MAAAQTKGHEEDTHTGMQGKKIRKERKDERKTKSRKQGTKTSKQKNRTQAVSIATNLPFSATKQRRQDLLLRRRLEYDFLACLCALLPTWFFFSFFSYFFLHPGMFIFVSLRKCSSHLLLSASAYFIPGSTYSFSSLSFVPYPISEFFTSKYLVVFLYSFSIFFVAFISRVAFICCTLVPGTPYVVR